MSQQAHASDREFGLQATDITGAGCAKPNSRRPVSRAKTSARELSLPQIASQRPEGSKLSADGAYPTGIRRISRPEGKS